MLSSWDKDDKPPGLLSPNGMHLQAKCSRRGALRRGYHDWVFWMRRLSLRWVRPNLRRNKNRMFRPRITRRQFRPARHRPATNAESG